MEKAQKLIKTGERVGILFGPERAGLSNEDTGLARDIISIPVNPKFPSLNLAQSVLLTAYEWRNYGGDTKQSSKLPRLASSREVQVLIDSYEEDLSKQGFFWPDDKADSMRLHLRSLFSRLKLTEADVRIFHGIRKSLVREKRVRD